MDNNIAYRLKLLRKKLGLSQLEMAEQMGLTAQTQVSRFENGVNMPSIEALNTLSKHYSIDLNWIVFGEVENKTQPHNSADAADITDMIYSQINLLSKIARQSIEIAGVAESLDSAEIATKADQQREVIDSQISYLMEVLQRIKRKD